MSKHTKGPWEVKSHQQFFPTDYTVHNVHGGGFIIAECAGSHRDQEESKANANLISAAPEILEALIDIIDVCDCDYTNAEAINRFSAAEQAIKKAIGEA